MDTQDDYSLEDFNRNYTACVLHLLITETNEERLLILLDLIFTISETL